MAISVLVAGRALEDEVLRLIEEWRLICPDESAAWTRNCRAQKAFLRDAKAFSAGRLMQFRCTLPAHVHLCIGRFLDDHNWSNDPKLLERVLSIMQVSRMPS